MPQNIPYPGESMEEFQRRMNAQGRVDPLAYGTLRPPQAPSRDPNAPFIPSNLSPDRPFFGEAGFPIDFAFSGEVPQQNPFDVPGVTMSSAPQNATTGLQEQAPGTEGGMVADAFADQRLGETAWASLGLLGKRLVDWWGGDQPAPEAPAQPPQPGMPFGGPAQTADSQAGAGGMQRDSSGFQRDMYSPIPPSGEEVVDDSPMPQLGREQVEAFLRQMEGTAPGQFARDDVDGSRILASMGQALAGAGQAPTVGEALLSLGTGGTSAVAQHEEEQRQLEREHSENQREFQRQLAEQAFAGEQALLQSEQQARQFDLKMDQAIAQADARRMDALSKQSGLKVSGDNIVITKPKLDKDGNPTNQTSVEVINTEQQQGLLDAAAVGGKAENISLPKIGGFDPATALAGVSEDGQADIVTSANLEAGAIPLSRIQDPRVQQRIQQIRQQAEQKVISKYAKGDEVQGISGLAAMPNAPDIGDIQDEVELEQWRAIVDEMGRNPVVRYSVWQASGNPQLRRIADPALQQYREQFDNGSQ